jgi:hypothetical protein
MKQQHYPAGWDERRVRKLLQHYEKQTEEEAVAEDEAAYLRRDQTVMVVPKKLVPTITKMIAREESKNEPQHVGLTKAVHSTAALVRLARKPKGLG